jgi:hypothetical protein
METREITIRVDAEAAKAYAAATSEERKKIDLLLSLRLRSRSRLSLPHSKVMRKISEVAQERDLTEERLSDILRKE